MKNKRVIFITIALVLIIVLGLFAFNMVKKTERTKVLLETNQGNITIELRSDQPITSGNFKSLV